MEIIGEIERFVAQNLYPYRVPLALLGAFALAGLIVAARRRGWFTVMRRHKIWTTVGVVVLLVVFGPLTWYLASPLLISTEVVEAAPPTAAPATSAAGLGADAGGPSVSRSGTFVGADEFHFGSGTASLLEGSDGRVNLRFEDFAVRNGPDLYVYLSPDPDGFAEGALELGTLKADTGAFNYELPPDSDPMAYASVVIWCKQFAVQFAHASLSP